MKREQAIKHYLKRTKNAEKTIKYLMGWNPKLTLKELAKKFWCTESCVRNISVRFDLRFKRVSQYV